MKRSLASITALLLILFVAGIATAAEKKPKPGKLTGAWECTSHGSSQGDMPFTLYLEHTKDVVTGSVSSPMGGTDITSGSYKNKKLEIRLETPQGTYVVTGKLKKRQLIGEWSHDAGEKGTWEGKKQVATASR